MQKNEVELHSINSKNCSLSDGKNNSSTPPSLDNLLIRWAGLELKFPQHIKAFVIIDKICPLDNNNKRGVKLKCKINHIDLSDFFLIFSIEDKILAIIRYEGYRDYRMYYYAKLPESFLMSMSSLRKNQFMPISQNFDFSESDYIEVIGKQILKGSIVKEKKSKEIVVVKKKEKESKKNLVSTYLRALGFKQESIEKAIAILFAKDNELRENEKQIEK